MAATLDLTPFRLITSFILARPPLFAGAMVAIIASAFAEIAFPWLLQHGIDAALGEESAWTVGDAAIAMLGVILAIVVGHAFTLLFETVNFASASYDLKRRIYSRIESAPFAILARHRSGSLAYRTASDVASLETGIVELFGECLFDVLVVTGAVVAMALTDWRLTATVVAVMVIATAIGTYFGAALPVYKRAMQMLSARLAGKLQESISTARTVRAFGAESQDLTRLDEANLKIRGINIRGGILRALVTPIWHFAEALGIVAVIWFGGNLVANGNITVGSLVAFIAYQQLVAGPINRMGSYYYQFQSARGIASRITTLLQQVDSAEHGKIDRHGDGSLTLEDVTFRYPGTERIVLDGISFSVATGEHVAIIGRNGAGKSSLFDLLMGFYLPERGNIRSANADLATTTPASWRANLGLMQQETVLFQASLANNLAIARPQATREALTGALIEAGGSALLKRLPAGIDSVVGERGQTLSGGERQIVGLARLILRDPKVVLLDEPTAHLDGTVLSTVVDAIARFVASRTLLLITHNLDVMALAERAIVIDDGRVLADGRHDDLARDIPLYRDLLRTPMAPEGAARPRSGEPV